MLDKFLSCARQRIPAIADEDCRVCLPCSEEAFRAGAEQEMPLLETVTEGSPSTMLISSPTATLVFMTSTLSRVVHYTLEEDKYPSHGIPWSSASQHAAIESTLLQIESDLSYDKDITESISQQRTTHGTIDQQKAGPFILSRAFFHVSSFTFAIACSTTHCSSGGA